MKAIILEGFGGVENLVVSEQPVPVIKENEVLVQVKAIGINPVDIKARKGKSLADALQKQTPIILGWDIAGIVVSTGDAVTSFRNGDEVFGLINFPGHGRAYAEFVAAPEAHLALKPSGITFEEAAGASLAALTAWQILKEKVKLKPDDKVLIHGAAGGVGHFAVQMAKFLGADVAGTASAANREFVLSLGASMHIDYEDIPFETVVHDIDFVLDTIGGEYIDRSLKVLRKGGTIICIPTIAATGVEEKAAEARNDRIEVYGAIRWSKHEGNSRTSRNRNYKIACFRNLSVRSGTGSTSSDRNRQDQGEDSIIGLVKL